MRKLFPCLLLLLCLMTALLPAAALAQDGLSNVSAKVSYDNRSSYIYDGNPVTFDPQCEGITEWMISYSDSLGGTLGYAPSAIGSYSVQMIGKGTDCYADVTHSFSIVEGQIDYSVEDYSGVYDGKAHSIDLTVSTPDVTVSYAASADGEYSTDKPMFTESGTYTVYYSLEKEFYKTETGSATVTIAKADVSDQVTFDGKDAYTYTGAPVAFSPACDGITSWSFTYYDKNGTKLSDAPSAPGSYTVEMSGEGANCIAKVTHAYAIEQVTIEYTVNSYNGVYDGQPHAITVNVSTPDVVVTYAIAKDGAYSATKPAFTDAGTYTVYFRLEKTNYETVESSATVTITKADVSDKVTFNKQDAYTYTGAPVAFSPACDGITSWSFTYYDKNGTKLTAAPSAPGSYTVEMSGEGANCIAKVTHAYAIEQVTIEYTVNSYNGVYDGQPHAITVNVSTPDVAVTYAIAKDGAYSATKPAFTDAGTYTVYFRLEKTNYETVESSATVTIAKADVSDQVTFDGKDAYTYTDEPVAFRPACDGITSWSFTYYDKNGTKLSDAPSVPGSYTVEMSGEGANCIAKVTHAYAIDPATFEYIVTSYNGEYDGEAHSIIVNASIMGIVKTYATAKDGAYSTTRPMFTDVGTYTVYFRLERTGFKTMEGSATVTIKRGDFSNRVTFNKKDTYASTGEPVAFNPTCEGITSWSFTYYGKNGAKLSAAPSKPGSYTVEISGEGANCYAKVTHAYSISDAIDPDNYSAESYSGEYDGQPHSIRLNFDPDVLTTQYSVDGGVDWQNNKPEFTNVGKYTVHVRALKGSEIVWEGSASVTITKGTPQLYFTPGHIVFQRGEKSRQLEWVYTGDGKLHFTSSDSRHFWVDPSGGLVSCNQEGGVSIWATAPETDNWKSVTAMCTVETESTLPQIDIDTELIYTKTPSDFLREEVIKISSGKDNLILYLDAKLFDPRDPLHKMELHNVRASFTVPYKEILKESQPDPGDIKLSASDIATSFDYTVLHQMNDNTIEKVPFIPSVGGLKIGDTTFSPFAIVAFPKENYNLYYDVNGGTGTPMNQRVPMFGESYSVRVSSDQPSREGYDFVGWSLSRGGDVQVMPGSTITLDRDIVLFAVWEEADTPADLPQTGDSARPDLWLLLGLLSTAGLATLILRGRKSRAS